MPTMSRCGTSRTWASRAPGPVQASTSSNVMPSSPIRRRAFRHRVGADAVGDKIRCILGDDNAFRAVVTETR